jgi:hypothetical protein
VVLGPRYGTVVLVRFSVRLDTEVAIHSDHSKHSVF